MSGFGGGKFPVGIARPDVPDECPDIIDGNGPVGATFNDLSRLVPGGANHFAREVNFDFSGLFAQGGAFNENLID